MARHPLWTLFRNSSFLPTQYAGLALWLDADDPATTYQDSAGTTPAVSDADPVGLWQDRSGNGRHLSTTTDAERFTLRTGVQNGRRVLRSDGVDDSLAFTPFAQALPCYLYGVISNTGGSSGYRLLLGRSGALAPALYAGNAAPTVPEIYWQAAAKPSFVAVVTGFRIYRYRLTSSSSTGIQIDGGTEVTGNPGVSDLSNWTHIGRAAAGIQLLGADWCELIMYQGVTLDATQDAQIRAYLKAKWGTP